MMWRVLEDKHLYARNTLMCRETQSTEIVDLHVLYIIHLIYMYLY